jgi:hypothetical protein
MVRRLTVAQTPSGAAVQWAPEIQVHNPKHAPHDGDVTLAKLTL